MASCICKKSELFLVGSSAIDEMAMFHQAMMTLGLQSLQASIWKLAGLRIIATKGRRVQGNRNNWFDGMYLTQ